jgi:ribosome-associated protein
MADDLFVRDGVVIPRDELTIRATRAGGPGGQHVNTSATRIEVVWNVVRTRALTEDQRRLVLSRLAPRVDADGDLRVVAADSRSQRQNRTAAESRLAAIVARALVVPKRRRPTRPTAASVRQRLDAKRRRADTKQQRRRDPGE